MGGRLQQVLRSLCFNTGWKYAVFWKLKHQERMLLTWEDAYCDSNNYPDKKGFNVTVGSLSGGPYLHDSLGLVVAKMSYEVYSLEEGIVGQVAVSGKHSWIFSDQHVPDSSLSTEYFGGWQGQFSAGIKTIAVVAVIPHGVVQLGSLQKIAEDLKLVDHIRNVFFELQDQLPGCIPSSRESKTKSSCQPDTCTKISDLDVHDSLARLKGSFPEDEANVWFQLFLPVEESCNHSHVLPPSGGLSSKVLKTKIHENAMCSMPGNEFSLPSNSENILARQLRLEEMEALNNTKYGGKANELSDLGKKPEITSMPPIKDVSIDKSNLYNATLPTADSKMVTSNLPSEILDSAAFENQGDIHVPELQKMQISPFSYCTGYELLEALGPSFHNQIDCAWQTSNNGSHMAIEMSEGIGSCSLLTENSDMHLLDAVVAKVGCKGDDTGSEKSCRDTGESLLTAEKTRCSSVATNNSAGYTFDRDTSSSLNSVAYSVESLKAFSSTSSSKGSEHLERPREAVKINKKRARPGESCRPRPRDRQLIQDRIKELRELVPNGSKCSIDSLLERTIKHMLFLQSITKHAEKLNKCSVSKLLDKDAGMQRFSCYEQGSSWAVEVGNNQKVCPIMVENINMNGQMLVEMLCEECTQFLEIAETIRSLGLTILKGVSQACGNKTWMCFLVEGQNNRNMHRMDILWSLMQLLQPKISH